MKKKIIKWWKSTYLEPNGSGLPDHSPARSLQLFGRRRPVGSRRSSRCGHCPGGPGWLNRMSSCHDRSWWKPSGLGSPGWWNGSSSQPYTWNTPRCGLKERRELPTWCGPNRLPGEKKKKKRPRSRSCHSFDRSWFSRGIRERKSIEFSTSLSF